MKEAEFLKLCMQGKIKIKDGKSGRIFKLYQVDFPNIIEGGENRYTLIPTDTNKGKLVMSYERIKEQFEIENKE